MASILTINGSVVNRVATRTVLNRLTLSLDQPDVLEFAQVGATLPGNWIKGQSASITVDGTLRFSGRIASRHLQRDDTGWTIGYRAMGLKWLANRIPVTNAQDGTGSYVFNLQSTDDDYISTNSGLSVGDILARIFTDHAAALSAVGITGYTAGDLTPLSIVPNEPVVFQGSRLWNCVEDLLAQYYGQYAAYIPAAGGIRVRDTTAFSATTVTLDDDANPWILDAIDEDSSEAATRVVLRGFSEIEPAYLSLAESTLAEHFTGTDKTNWTWYSFTQPGGAIDDGNITALTSTTATVQSSDATRAWATNFWNGISGWIELVNAAVSGVNFSEFRYVSSCTAMVAGSTSVITLDRALNNSGYTKYHLVGQPTGISETWRTYDIVPTWIAQHLVKRFPRSVPWRPTAGVVVQTNYPAATICWSASGAKPFLEFPATFEVLPATGQIRFSQPTVRTFGTLSNLELGGSHTDGIPTDIKVLIPYSRGVMQAVYPADVMGSPAYAGLAYSLDGLQQTLYRDYPQWLDAGDLASYQALAQQIHKTVSAPVIEATLRYEGKYSAGLALGMALNITGNGYTTGYESIAAPVRTVTLEWPQGGSAGSPWVTTLQVSTRRRPYSGDKLYEHPMFQGGQFAWDSGPSIDRGSAMESLSGTVGAEGAEALVAAQGGQADLGAPTIGAGYGGPGEISIPTTMQDLGIPTSMQDLGIPTSPEQYFGGGGGSYE